ncbi:MAG: metal-dependent hydrolase [Methylobacter sp.]
MANFKTHLSIAAATGIGAAIVAVDAQLITHTDMPWFIFLGILGGLLPDIDAENSRPVKLLFNLLAFTALFMTLSIFKDQYPSHVLLTIAVGTYLLVRYGLFALFNRFTVHRGVFHSLLATLFFALFMTCISYHFLHWKAANAWLNGIFIALGFIAHLLLDELYSVDLSNSRMKKSFGTAFKLWGYNSLAASVLMTLCTVALYWAAPPVLPLAGIWEKLYSRFI